MTGDRVVSTLCRMCEQGCGLIATVTSDGEMSLRGDPKHPHSKGRLCAKGRAALDFLSSPRRLSSPVLRDREGHSRTVSWPEALTFAADELHRLRRAYGPESLAIYHGEGVGHQEIKAYMKRFANVYGTPNFMGVGSLCNAARTIADTLTLGQVTRPDVSNTSYLLVWGANPLVSNEPVTPHDLGRLRRRGARLVVVDPRETPTARLADDHLALRPGTDDVLAANLLHVILGQKLCDRAFTERWIEGFPALQGLREDRFSPEAGERLTGLSPEFVRRVAAEYAGTSPAAMAVGNGVEHHETGVGAMRLLALLRALTGNLDVPGGDLFSTPPSLTDISAPLAASTIPPLGSATFPVFCHLRREAHALALPDAVLDGKPYPIRGLIIAGGNPSLEWPESRRVREALRKLEFLMVIDVVDSPDSRNAHVVLPACTFLERDEHRVPLYHNQQVVLLRRAVVHPVCGLPDQTIWAELARAMGFGEHFPWQTPKEGIDHILGGIGLTYKGLVEEGGVFEYEQRRYRKYESGGFRTPTGKVEVEPELLRRFGYDPSPIPSSLTREAASTQDYPLTLSTGANLAPYLHWQYRDLPRLRRVAPEPLLEIHPKTARRHGISAGDLVDVETPSGSICLAAAVTEAVRPDTVHLPQGWEKANANELTGAENSDPISGFPNLKSVPCRIRRAVPG